MVCLAVREKKPKTKNLFTKYLFNFRVIFEIYFPDQWLGILKKSIIKT